MVRRTLQLAVLSALLLPLLLYAQHSDQAPSQAKSGAKLTDQQKIASAMSAAPANLAKNATILDWPETTGGQPRQLRAGTNGWVCYPSMPSTLQGASGEDPMCLDRQWQNWLDAWTNKTTPKVTGTGIAYMLRGDRGASNTDPFAMGSTPTNQWIMSPPHIMVLFEDTEMLDAYPTDPMNGGPWVMWKGTPYVHLMVPVSETKAATRATN